MKERGPGKCGNQVKVSTHKEGRTFKFERRGKVSFLWVGFDQQWYLIVEVFLTLALEAPGFWVKNLAFPDNSSDLNRSCVCT